jgi:cupin superfamily acireductone dioxygenase involved in methionine salvage
VGEKKYMNKIDNNNKTTTVKTKLLQQHFHSDDEVKTPLGLVL